MFIIFILLHTNDEREGIVGERKKQNKTQFVQSSGASMVMTYSPSCRQSDDMAACTE